jgi:WD40 repeat protein
VADAPKKRSSPKAASEEAALPAYVAHYKITRMLGRGVIGTVYEAVEEKPPRNVALKVVRGEFFSKSALKRFHVYAKILPLLQHPNFAAVYATGIAKSAHGLEAYFAGELVSGQALESFARSKQLSNEARLLLVAQVAEAIHYAHVKGVVHRDLKPANILIGKDGQPRILDVGVVKCTDADIAAVAAAADVGVLSYMVPEQTAGKAAAMDARTDVYALGVIAHHILTGRLPYDLKLPEFADAVEVLRQTPAKRLSESDPTLRGEIETIVGRALEKEPDKRYQSALEFAGELRRFAEGRAAAAGPAGGGGGVLLGVMAVLIAALLAGVIVLAMRASRAASSETTRASQMQTQSDELRAAMADEAQAKQTAAQADDEAARAKKQAQTAEEEAATALAAEQKAEDVARAQAEQLKAAETQPTVQDAPPQAVEVRPTPTLLPMEPFPVAEQAEALLQSGNHDLAVDRLIRARALAVNQQASTVPIDLVLTNLLLQYPPPLYFNSAIKGATNHIFLLPDGKTLVASDQRDVVVIDAATGSVERRFGAFGNNIRDLAVSPDGALVAVTAHVRPRCRTVFTLADGKQIQFQTDDPKPTSVAFSPKGSPLVYCEDGRIMAFNPRDMTKEQSQSIDIFDPHVSFSHDGSEIFVTGSNHHFMAFAADTLKNLATINNPGESGLVSAIGAPDGKSVIVGSDAGVVRRSLPSYNVTADYPDSYGGIPVLSPSGKLLADFSGQGVHLYDTASCRELGLLEDRIPHHTQGNSLAISADLSTLFDLDFYSGLRAWPISSARFPCPVGTHGGSVRALAISPDSLLGVSSADDHTARLWDLASGMPLAMLGGHSGLCAQIAFGTDPTVMYSLSDDGRFLTWDVEGRAVTATKRMAASALAVSADGKLYATAAAPNSPLVVSSLAGDKPPGNMTLAPYWAACDDIQFSPDGAMLAANTSDGGNLYDLHSFTTIELEKSLAGGQIAFSHDGSEILAGMRNGELAHWSVGATTAVFMESHHGSITCLRASSDGTFVAAAGSDRTITLSVADSLQTLTTFGGFPREVGHLALSPDGRYLMAASGNDVYLIDLHTGQDYIANYDAAQAARTRLDTVANDPQALLTLGLYYSSRRADAWAVELLKRAKDAGADVPALPLARSYWRLHQAEPALQEFRRAIERKEAPEYYLKLCINAVNYPPPAETGG